MKRCPLKSGEPCRPDCAWWLADSEDCAVSVIAFTMGFGSVSAKVYALHSGL